MRNQSPDSSPTTASQFVNHPVYASDVAGDDGVEQVGSRLTEALRESGLTLEDVDDQWAEATAAAASRELGVTIHGEAVRIPYFDRDGNPILDRGEPFARFKLLDPADKADGRKYMAPAGSGNHLYIPPHFADLWRSGNAKFPDTLFITEGEKKAVAAVKAGYLCVGIPGVQQWSDSAVRNEQKALAELAGEKPEGLSSETPVMPELSDLVREMKDDVRGDLTTLVLFDADGAQVERKDIKDRATGDLDPEFKLLEGANTKKYALNPSVHHAARKLAEALTQQFAVRAHPCFVPHGSQSRQVSHAGKLVWTKRLTRRGFDDWLRESEAEIVESTLRTFVEQARAVKIPEVRDEGRGDGPRGEEKKKRLAKFEGTQGYQALGHETENGTTRNWFWSVSKNAILAGSKQDLRTDTWIWGLTGVDYAETRWSVPDGEEGEAEVFSPREAARDLIREIDAAGRWSTQNEWKAGVWDDGQGGLLINSEDGVVRVIDGELEPAERLIPTSRGTAVLSAVQYGDIYDGDEASEQDVEWLSEALERGWNLPRPSDGVLLAGWTLMQAYVGALGARPNMVITGETSTGKSVLVDFLTNVVGPWGYQVTDAAHMSPAYIRSRLGGSAMTLILDEAEPDQVGKPGSGGRIGMPRNFVLELYRALRASYSMRRVIGHGVPDGERRAAHTTAGGKGTADGGARDETLCASALICAIAPPQVEGADKNRMIHVELGTLQQEHADRGIPRVDDRWVGARLFLRMWRRWPRYKPTLEAVAEQIDSKVARMRWTLASPIAALLVALDEPADGEVAREFIDRVNNDRCGEGIVGGYRQDHELVLNSLLSLPTDIDNAGSGGNEPLVSVIANALRAGMGQKGRGKSGDKWGDALRLRGMSAKRDEAGQAWLFIAESHHQFQVFCRDISASDVCHILARVPGVVPADQKNGTDRRVRLSKDSSTRHVGIWIPVPVELDNEEGSSSEEEKNPLA